MYERRREGEKGRHVLSRMQNLNLNVCRHGMKGEGNCLGKGDQGSGRAQGKEMGCEYDQNTVINT